MNEILICKNNFIVIVSLLFSSSVQAMVWYGMVFKYLHSAPQQPWTNRRFWFD